METWFQNTQLCLVEEESLHNCKEKLKMEALFFHCAEKYRLKKEKSSSNKINMKILSTT